MDIAIIGGGAAGLATAIFAARSRTGTRVAVFDGARTLGAKILVSGGGRCNVTNREVRASDFNTGHPRLVSRVLRALPVADTVAFFRALGVSLHEERWGKLFPDSNRARTVLDALLAECTARGIELRTSQLVAAIGMVDGHFRIDTSAGAVTARRLVLATGGLSLPRTGSDGRGYAMAASLGHSIVPTTPALVPLILNGDFHDGLAGVSHEARVRVGVANGVRIIEGPMLWTHVGVSGPAILDASRHWLRKVHEGEAASLSLQLMPAPFDAVERWLLDAASARPRATVAATLAERLPASLAARIARLQAAEDVTLASLERDTRRRLVHTLTDLALPVRESRGYNHAEVTAGGVSLHEVHPETLESRKCAGLYLVGEILDVDGRLGGFNFQWAWSSGRVAGEAAARSLDG